MRSNLLAVIIGMFIAGAAIAGAIGADRGPAGAGGGGGSGDVVGPASATDQNLVRFSGTTGKLVAGGTGLAAPGSGVLNATGRVSSVGLTTTTSGLITSNAATDITTGTNEDLTLDANGVGKTVLADGAITVGTSTTNTLTSAVAPGSTAWTFDTAGGFGGSTVTHAFSMGGSDRLRLSGAEAIFLTPIRVASGHVQTPMLRMPSSALVLATGVVTTSPGANSFLRVSVTGTGTATWTPAIVSAEGQNLTICNVDAPGDTITLADGATWEGAGSVLDANDCATAIFDSVDNKWRQTGFIDN